LLFVVCCLLFVVCCLLCVVCCVLFETSKVQLWSSKVELLTSKGELWIVGISTFQHKREFMDFGIWREFSVLARFDKRKRDSRFLIRNWDFS
jgi:hypothetical protein